MEKYLQRSQHDPFLTNIFNELVCEKQSISGSFRIMWAAFVSNLHCVPISLMDISRILQALVSTFKTEEILTFMHSTFGQKKFFFTDLESVITAKPQNGQLKKYKYLPGYHCIIKFQYCILNVGISRPWSLGFFYLFKSSLCDVVCYILTSPVVFHLCYRLHCPLVDFFLQKFHDQRWQNFGCLT